MKQLSKRSTPVFLGLFIVIGAVAVVVGIWMAIQSLQCERWPTTEGRIERSEMSHQTGSGNPIHGVVGEAVMGN
jgi:hypothetical protein